MTSFTASNGITVENHGGNWDQTTIHFRGEVLGLTKDRTHSRDVRFEDRDIYALREYFQHEEDERFDRWRWPENPEFVVYAWIADTPRNARGVTVLSESIPRPYTVWEDSLDVLYGDSNDEQARVQARRAARAYFDAHPDPKPWHDAKPGEVWALMVHGIELPFFRVDDERGEWASRDTTYMPWAPFLALNAHGITDGRRIWPEVSS